MESNEAIVEGRLNVSKLLNCEEECIVFNSGGTESNNHAIIGYFLFFLFRFILKKKKKKKKKKKIKINKIKYKKKKT